MHKTYKYNLTVLKSTPVIISQIKKYTTNSEHLSILYILSWLVSQLIQLPSE